MIEILHANLDDEEEFNPEKGDDDAEECRRLENVWLFDE